MTEAKAIEKVEENISEEELKEAEKESLETEKKPKAKKEKSLAERKKELLEKVKKISEKIESPKTEELKEKIKIKRKTDMLIPLENYVKSGIYIGTKVITPNMRPFVYRRRADGLAIFNTDLIDDKLKEGVEYLSKFNPEDVILVCKRQPDLTSTKTISSTFLLSRPLNTIKSTGFPKNLHSVGLKLKLGRNGANCSENNPLKIARDLIIASFL